LFVASISFISVVITVTLIEVQHLQFEVFA